MEDNNYRTALGLILKSMHDAYEENKTANHQLLLALGPTPQVLLDLGFPQLTIAIKGSVVDKAVYDHGLTKSILERAYSILCAPKAIYSSENKDVPGACVLVAFEVNKGQEPLIIAMHPNRPVGRGGFYNLVGSIYYKQGENPEVKWTAKGLLLWSS